MIDRLPPLAGLFIKLCRLSVETVQPVNPDLGRQAVEQELAHGFRVTYRTVVTPDEQLIHFKGRECRRSILVVGKLTDDGRVERGQDSGTSKYLLLCRRLGVKDRLEVKIEGSLFLRQFLIGLVQTVTNDLGEVQDEP